MLSFALRCLLVMTLAGAGAMVASGQVSDDPGDNIGAGTLGSKTSGTLRYAVASDGQRGPVAAVPTVISLSKTPLVEFAKLPEFKSAKPLFSFLRLARHGKTHFALDQSRPDFTVYDLLYLDLNRNLDLTDDGPPLAGKTEFVERRDLEYSEFTNLSMELYYSKGVTEKYTFTLYAWYPGDGVLDHLLMTSSSWRQGTIGVEGQQMRIAVFDEGCGGVFSVASSSWCMAPASEDWSKLLDAQQRLPAGVPIWVGGVPYVVQSITPEGITVELESQTEHNAREAWQQYDPTRLEPPRDRTTDKVDWVSDLDAALKTAADKSRPIYLLFTVDWVRSAQQFEQRTLTDLKVVELLQEYVCVKVNPDLATGLKKRYGIEACPTGIILDFRGNEVERMVGYRQARVMESRLKSAMR